MQLPRDYLRRLSMQLDKTEFAAYLKAMDEPPRRGLRTNTLKITPQALQSTLNLPLSKADTAPEGFVLDGDTAGLGAQPMHRAGLFYIQEPSAMRPVVLLDPKPGMCVLDLCAAPGGKAGQIAARMNGEGILIANDMVSTRAQVLARTLERLGVRNAVVTNMPPDTLCDALAGRCDAVLVDAPCSGEGMFRKDSKAITDWSLAHVSACAFRQGNILDSSARTLKPGGMLCYSTCTFAPAEDEEVVDAFIQRQGGMFTLVKEERLWPHNSKGEGHYIALLKRSENIPAPVSLRLRGATVTHYPPPDEWHAFIEEYMNEEPGGLPSLLPDSRLMLFPPGVDETIPGWNRLRLVRCGVQAGELRSGNFFPGHALFLAYPNATFRHTAVLEEANLSQYFRGNIVRIPEKLHGWCAVSAPGLAWPLGFGKCTDGMLKNHLPRGLREMHWEW